MAYISIRNLSYWYPEEERESIRDLNLDIEKGEILFIVGKSGSGKSTFGKIISGAIPNFYGGRLKGELLVKGKALRDMKHQERAKEITMVFQDPERQLVMNCVHREIAFGLENVGVESHNIKRRVWEAMQFANIMELADRDINTLSGGQKQMVSIASALSYLPQCIILDEPTSQLDPTSAEEVADLVKKINEELGITVIVIEQRVDRWFDISDRLVMLDNGSLYFEGVKEEFYRKSAQEVRKFLPGYLRLARAVNINPMPSGFKKMRSEISKCNFTIRENKEASHVLGSECINVKNLNINYGEVRALRDVTFSAKRGEFIAILGANGAGKSTLLRTITGLNKYEGTVKLEGREVKKLRLQDIGKTAAYISQNPNDYISKDTVYEELRFTLDNHRIKGDGIIDEVLTRLGIHKLKNKNPRDISGGERQRVAIASMLVARPGILLIDEPTRGLDVEVKWALGEMLKELNNNGTTILLVTHDMEFASQFCRRFVLMFNGEVTADGTREQVLGEGIFYTTAINKLFRHLDNKVFSLDQIMEMKKE
jgi:energy-coupling factor transport system ATP-binding protein